MKISWNKTNNFISFHKYLYSSINESHCIFYTRIVYYCNVHSILLLDGNLTIKGIMYEYVVCLVSRGFVMHCYATCFVISGTCRSYSQDIHIFNLIFFPGCNYLRTAIICTCLPTYTYKRQLYWESERGITTVSCYGNSSIFQEFYANSMVYYSTFIVYYGIVCYSIAWFVVFQFHLNSVNI